MSMSTATRPTVSSPPPHHRITVTEYERIIEAGGLEDPAAWNLSRRVPGGQDGEERRP